MAPSSQKNTKSVVTMWRGPLHAYHDGLRAVITEAAASGSLSGPSVRGPGGTRIFGWTDQFLSCLPLLFVHMLSDFASAAGSHHSPDQENAPPITIMAKDRKRSSGIKYEI